MKEVKQTSLKDFIEELHRYTESLGVYLALDPNTYRIIGVTGLTVNSQEQLVDTMELLLAEVEYELDGEIDSEADMILLLLDTYSEQIKNLPTDKLNIIH